MDYHTTVNKMCLEQECALLSGQTVFTTRAMPQYGIPSIWLSDGPHGLRKQVGAADHLGLNPSEPATCYPTAATVAASWDPELGEAIGRALGAEAAAQGVSVVLGPGLNIKRSPLCGRNFEYFSEDPYLAGKLAAGYIRGIQANGVAACPKHFAANSQELRRMTTDSVVDERTLREIYLTGFEIAVKEGRPKAIMSAYNLLNGVYANENPHLLQEILRDEWGFDGAVITDWGGSNSHVEGVRCGSTLEMPAPGGDSIRELAAAVENGTLPKQAVDDRVAELLALIESTAPALADGKPFDQAAHHALARRAAAESTVLLKNEGAMLPLAAGAKVAVIGDFAKTPRYQGAGSSLVNPTQEDSFQSCIQNSSLQIVGCAAGFRRHGEPDDALRQEAVTLARTAEAVLLCLGLDEIQETEGLDRTAMRLAQNQIELLHAVAAANPNTVVLLHAGSAVETAPWLGDCRALVYACLGGQAGAGALVDVITGKVNPGGKLPETWPIACADTPAYSHYPSAEKTAEYREGLFVGYRYYTTAGVPVQFPFGYGLSYTTFAYQDLAVTGDRATLTVTNTGSKAGTEIVQLYIGRVDAKNAAVFRPLRELKGFARITLEPGQSGVVTIPLDDKAFRYFNTKTNRWEVEGGSYRLLAGASCEDIRLQTTLEVGDSGAPNPYAGQELAAYRTGRVQAVADEQFAALLGRPIPDGRRHGRLTRNDTFGEMNRSKSPLGWLAWAVLTAMKNHSEKIGKPNLNVLFLYNMPFRALAKMTNGAVSMEMVDGMVAELNGWWLVGIARVMLGFLKNAAANAALEHRLNRIQSREGRTFE